jgi:hypothetical protein
MIATLFFLPKKFFDTFWEPYNNAATFPDREGKGGVL